MRYHRILASVSVAALALAKPAFAQEAPQEAAANADVAVGDIIVTASRRSESLQKIPVAVSAVTGGQLKQEQIVQLSDLATSLPNIQIGNYAVTNNITIRGIGNTQTTAGAESGVALLSDGVYLGQSGLAGSTFMDIARVEVLRGPQGTLFGRSATGGAVNIIPNYPTSDFHAGFDVTAAVDPQQLYTSAYINGALSSDGTLLGRVSVQQSYNNGYTKNLAPDGPNRLDGVSNFSVRGQLKWLPTDKLSLRLLVEHQHEDDSGPAFFLVGVPSGTLPPFLQFPNGDINDRETYANQGYRRLDATLATLTGDLELGSGNLRLIASYNRTHVATDTDDDGTLNRFTDAAFENRAEQYYTEVLYTSDPSKPFNFLVGANFYHENLTQGINVPIADFPAPGAEIPVILGGNVKTRSLAGFAHAQYEIVPGLKLLGGLRYTSDLKTETDFNNFLGTGSGRARFHRLTYDAGISYDITSRITTYVKYSTGYKGGGFSLGSLKPAFNPETNAEFEAGLKGSFFDGRLQMNLAAFHDKYKDLQVTQIRGASTQVTNAARATINGVEAEVNARPLPNFRLQMAGAYLDAKFDQFCTSDSSRPTFLPDTCVANGVATPGINLAGNALPLAPRWSGSLAQFFDIPLSNGGMVTFTARESWKSRVYFSEFNLPLASQPSKATLDLSLSWTSADKKMTASLFGKNVTDEKILGNVTVVSALLGSAALGSLQPGREVGVSLGYHF